MHLRFDHVIVGGVEDVAADDPHDALLHHGLVGSPGQPRLRVLLAGPEGRVGGNGDGAVGTWGWERRGSQRVRVLQEAKLRFCSTVCEPGGGVGGVRDV